MNAVTMLEPMLVLETLENLDAAVPAATPKPRKPRVWTGFATLVAAAVVGQLAVFAGFMVTGIGMGIVMGAHGIDAATIQAYVQDFVQQPLPTLLLTLVPFQLGMTAVLLFAAWRSPEPFVERIGLLRPTGRTWGKARLATLAGFTIAAAFAVNIAACLLMGPPPQDDALNAAIIEGDWWTITLLSVVMSVIPALVEESLFRGYLQRRFVKRWSPTVGITVTTLLFAVMHFDSLNHIIAVIPLGAVTGLLAYRTNSVRPGMLVHGLHNVAAVGAGALITAASPYFTEEAVGLTMLTTVGVLGLIGLPAVISLLRRPKPQPAVETCFVPEPMFESLSVLTRELGLPDYGADSRLAGQAL